MNSIARAQTAYADARSVTVSGRDTEYRAFARATRALSELPETGPTAYPALVAALHDNLALWRAIALDVSNERNSLPAPLRAQLFYLFEFTASHSRAVIDGKGSVDALIDINRAVMRGLRPEAGQG